MQPGRRRRAVAQPQRQSLYTRLAFAQEPRAARRAAARSPRSRPAALSISVSKSQRSRKRSRGTNALRAAGRRASATSRSWIASWPETPREPRPRQSQQFAEARDAHRAQQPQAIRMPRRAGDRQLRQTARERRGILDQRPFAAAGQPKRRQCRGRGGAVRRDAELVPSRVQAAHKCSNEPNSRRLPLISSSNALGGSTLTNDVNRCAYRAQRCRTWADRCSADSCGNTAAYQSCRACAAAGVVRRRRRHLHRRRRRHERRLRRRLRGNIRRGE